MSESTREQELQNAIQNLLLYICRVDGSDTEHESIKAAINAICSTEEKG